MTGLTGNHITGLLQSMMMQLSKKKYFVLAVLAVAGVLMVWQRGCAELGYSSNLPVRDSQLWESVGTTINNSSAVLKTLPQAPSLNFSTPRLGFRGNISSLEVQKIWPVEHGNCLSNFFYQEDSHLALTKYRSSNIVFLHHNKAGGSTIRACIEEMAPSSHLTLGSLLVSYKHVNTVYELLRKGEAGRTLRMGYMGGYSFGICDALHNKRPCSYFTMLRDPYERAISCYFFCQKSAKDQLCTALNASNVTVREWALHQGSYFFNQVLIHPRICQGSSFDQYFKLDGIQHKFWHGEPPCWFRQKVILDNYLSADQRTIVLDYVVDHLQEWFAAVGLIEEFNLSLDMFQHVYGLPFKDHCSGKHFQVGKYKKHRKEDMTAEELADKAEMIKRLKEELMSDPEVRKSLHADFAIYTKAKEIFNKQKKVFYTIKNGQPPDQNEESVL